MTVLPPPPAGSPGRAPGPRNPGPRTVKRPEVARAAEHALLPLRALTVGEVLDIGFVVVRQHARVMIGLPMVVAVLNAVWVLLLWGAWTLLDRYASVVAAWVVVGLLGLGGLLVGAVLVVWQSAVLARFSLQTVLGDGFAPSVSRITWRANLRLLAPMAAFTVLASILLTVLYYLTSFASLVLIPFTGSGDPVLGWVGGVLLSVLLAALACWGWSYVLLAVPAYALESATAPSWIGRPQVATWVPSAFARAFVLVGLRQVPRAIVVAAATLAMTVGAFAAVVLAVTLLGLVYGEVLPFSDVALEELFTRPQTWFVLVSLLSMLAGALAPFGASVQTVFYLDLRIRREGLDLPLRFDCVDVPQPRVPRLPYLVPMMPPPPPPSPAPPRPAPSRPAPARAAGRPDGTGSAR